MLGEISSDDACLEFAPKVLNGSAICVVRDVNVRVSRAHNAPAVSPSCVHRKRTAIKAGCYYLGGE